MAIRRVPSDRAVSPVSYPLAGELNRLRYDADCSDMVHYRFPSKYRPPPLLWCSIRAGVQFARAAELGSACEMLRSAAGGGPAWRNPLSDKVVSKRSRFGKVTAPCPARTRGRSRGMRAGLGAARSPSRRLGSTPPHHQPPARHCHQVIRHGCSTEARPS